MDYASWIREPANIRADIQHCMNEIERLRSQCERSTPLYGIEFVQTTQHGNSRETALIKLADQQNQLSILMVEYDKKCAEIRDFLYSQLSAKDADLLDWRHCSGLSNMELADLKGTSDSAVRASLARAERRAKTAYNTIHGITERSNNVKLNFKVDGDTVKGDLTELIADIRENPSMYSNEAGQPAIMRIAVAAYKKGLQRMVTTVKEQARKGE